MPQFDTDAGVEVWGAFESPWQILVYDVRAMTSIMTSFTADTGIAERFLDLRDSDGAEHAAVILPTRRVLAEPLKCPLTQPLGAGALFRAEEMEDKWDIFLHDGAFHFARSWTGELIFRADCRPNPRELTVVAVECQGETDVDFAISAVDYLVMTHVLGLPFPLRLPADLPKKDVIGYSFHNYGRRAQVASFDDPVGAYHNFEFRDL